MLVAVIAPFFTSFLVRTLSWQYLLGDNELWSSAAAARCTCSGADGHLLATPFAVVTGLTYNFLPFMVLPLYASLEKIDPRLLEAGADLYASPFDDVPQGHAAAVDARPGRRHAADLHPRRRRLHQLRAARQPADPDDRQRDPGPLRAPATTRPPPSLSVTLMAAIVLMVFVYVRRAGTEELRVSASRRWLGDRLSLLAIGLLVLLYMFVPIFVVIADVVQRARRAATATASTGSRWTTGRNLCGPSHLRSSVRPARRSGCWPRCVATLLGTLMAFAMVRHRFRGRAAANLFVFLPMATPEIVMGSSLLALFVNAGLRRRARLLDHLHRARAVLPVLRRGDRQGAARRPGPAAGAGRDGPLRQRVADVLAGHASRWSSPASWRRRCCRFSLSFDDFIITNLNAGQHGDLPDVRLGRRASAASRRRST